MSPSQWVVLRERNGVILWKDFLLRDAESVLDLFYVYAVLLLSANREFANRRRNSEVFEIFHMLPASR